MKTKEVAICGLAAVKAEWAARPEAFRRLFFDRATSARVGAISRELAKAKKVYRCVEAAELAKIAGSIHHSGIVAIVEAAPLRAPTETELREWARRGEPLLVLDRVGNAHNLGALARTAAYFGVPRIVVADDAAAAVPGEAAHRVAEGGLAHLEVLRAPGGLAEWLRALAAAGYEVIGAATRGGRPDAGAVAGKPVALVLGNEEQGMAPEVARACTRLVTLPGSGKVESLNVSVAGAILIWELLARSRRSVRQ
jgi:TrmH RNA methyltransferase